MIFGDPRWLMALAAVPVFALIELWSGRRSVQALERLVGTRRPTALLEQLLPGTRRVGAILRLAALTLIVLGAARPQWGREVVRRGATGSDVVFLIDVSMSMDSRDVPPSRLSESKREALAVLERMGGSRVGIVAFSGDAVRLCPLTLDRAAAHLILESLSSSTLSVPGTDIGKGLRMALRTLPRGRREEQAIVLWTDGEDLEQGARGAIDDVARAGIRVFAVGVGTPAGDVVPVLDGAGRVLDVKRDAAGSLVRSRLDEDLLRGLGRGTHGGYFAAHRPGGDLTRLLNALSSLTRAGKGDRLIERPQARFPLFAALAMILLVIERARPRRRKQKADGAPLHSEERAAAAAIVLLALLLPRGAEAQTTWAKGDGAFKSGRYAEAESLYALRLKKGGPAEVRVNRATAQAVRGANKEARAELERLAERKDRIGVQSGYNLGTTLGNQQENEAGITALRRVLERDPNNQDARWNYEILLQRMRSQEKKKSNEDKPEPSPSKPNPQSGPGKSPPQNPSAGNPPPSNPSPSSSPPGGSTGTGQMGRGEAEQILDALQELARVDQQRQRRVKVMREKQGKDW